MRLPREEQTDIGVAIRRIPVVDVETVSVEVAKVDDVAVGIERYLSIFVCSTGNLVLLSPYLSGLFTIFPVFYLAAALVLSGHLL